MHRHRAALGRALAVLGGLALAGPVAGALWAALAPRERVQAVAGGAVTELASRGAAFATEGWFVVVTAGFGALSGALVWARTRDDGVAAVLALALGGTLAAVIAALTGHWLGPGPVDLARVPVGASAQTPITVRSPGALLIWPIVALTVYFALTVGFARTGAASPPGRSEPSLPR